MVNFNFFSFYFLVQLTIKNELYLQKLQYVTTSGKAGVEPRVLQTDEGRCPACRSQFPITRPQPSPRDMSPITSNIMKAPANGTGQVEELGH